jgi:hypothetical protein
VAFGVLGLVPQPFGGLVAGLAWVTYILTYKIFRGKIRRRFSNG